MIISQKIKAINSKIWQNKAQYNLDRQTAQISALSSGNFGKYDFLTGKNIFIEKDLLEKVAAIKRFEYSPLRREINRNNKALLNRNKLLKNYNWKKLKISW